MAVHIKAEEVQYLGKNKQANDPVPWCSTKSFQLLPINATLPSKFRDEAVSEEGQYASTSCCKRALDRQAALAVALQKVVSIVLMIGQSTRIGTLTSDSRSIPVPHAAVLIQYTV